MWCDSTRPSILSSFCVSRQGCEVSFRKFIDFFSMIELEDFCWQRRNYDYCPLIQQHYYKNISTYREPAHKEVKGEGFIRPRISCSADYSFERPHPNHKKCAKIYFCNIRSADYSALTMRYSRNSRRYQFAAPTIPNCEGAVHFLFW